MKHNSFPEQTPDRAPAVICPLGLQDYHLRFIQMPPEPFPCTIMLKAMPANDVPVDLNLLPRREHSATVRQLSTSAWAAQEAVAVAQDRARTITLRADAAAAACQEHKVHPA